jgi:AraC-like DNA-binding protein
LVDCAADAAFSPIHVSSVSEAMQSVHSSGACAMLLSPAIMRRHSVSEVSALVRRSPGVLSIAVLGTEHPEGEDALLTLGACGVRRLVNISEREGWACLRSLVDQTGGDEGTVILTALLRSLPGNNEELRFFFGELVRIAPSITNVRALARSVRIGPSTLMSRFYRAGLPSPKLLLSMTRLTYAASFFEASSVSVADVALALGYSSPQSFGRHVRHSLGLSAGEYRRTYPLSRALEHFVDRLILPYHETLKTFVPLGPGFIVCRKHIRVAELRVNGR